MSFDGPPPRSYDNYPRRIVRHTIHHSDPGPDHDSERVRTEDERLKRIEEQLEREVRRDEYERRHRERISASTERAKYQERMDRLERDRVQSIVEDERNRQEVFSREERIRREQIRLEKDREFLRREQEHAEELFKRQRAEDLSRQQQQHRMASKELELAEELYRIQRLEQDVERRKLSRKERRTNSGKTATESRPAKVERIQSSGLSAPTPEEPRSFLSRWILGSTPTGKTEATPSKTEQAPKIEASSKVEPVARPDKSEPPLKSALLDLEGYFLQPAQDSLIQKSVVALSDSIDQHVYNHYGDRAASPPADFFLRIVQIDAGVLRLPQGLTNKNSFRLAAIRRMIASALIRNISAKGDPSTTFMPKEVVSLLTMTPAQGTERFRFGASSVLRRTAANLLRLGQNTESPEYTEFKSLQVKVASDHLHRQLSAIANHDSNDAARKEQLEAIMTKGAQIGVLLLLQPATYEFDWSTRFSIGSSVDDQGKGLSRPGPFVIFPALSKIGDSTGRELRKPQVVCKPEYLDEDDLAEGSVV